MNLTPYNLALIAGGFAIVGALIGAWINNYLSRQRAEKDRFVDALISFRETFSVIIQELDKNELTHCNIVLLEYPKNEGAMHRFIHYLKGKKLTRFKKIWAEYKQIFNHCKENEVFMKFKVIPEAEEAEYKKQLYNIILQIIKNAE